MTGPDLLDQGFGALLSGFALGFLLVIIAQFLLGIVAYVKRLIG